MATPTREDFLTGAPGAGLGGLRPLVFGDPNFDLPNFKPDRDYRTVRNSKFAADYEAKNPDISPFVNHGGKLLMWHGMDDPGPSVLATIEYYEQMKAATSSKLSGGPRQPRFEVRVSSCCRACITAAAVRALTTSTRSPRWMRGWRRASCRP